MWFGNGSFVTWYDLRMGTFGTLNPPPSSSSLWPIYEPSFFGTAGGSGLFAASCTCAEPTGPSEWYQPSTGQFQEALPGHTLNQAALDAGGTVLLADNDTLYRTGDWSEVGRAVVSNSAAGWGGSGAVISPDGRRIYREAVYGYPATIDHIEVFDATAVVPGTDSLVSLGTIALPDKATTCSATGAYWCDDTGRLAMDPAGTTLFWVGEQGLVVVPVPSAMSGVSSTSRAQATATARLARAASATSRH